MACPFPGMDPYLEDPVIWPGIHEWLIVELARTLNPRLRPHYYAAVEERIYETIGEDSLLVGVPDSSVVRLAPLPPPVRASTVTASSPSQPLTVIVPMPADLSESYLEIRQVQSQAVVTAVEILSPKNKRPGGGRRQYEQKRQRVLSSQTHLVEIDLLRQWPPMPFSGGAQSHYRILISRSERRPQADLYAFNVTEPMPTFPLPLLPGDEEQPVDLKGLMDRIYEEGSYDLRLSYADLPPPALSAEDAAWVRQQLSA
jgi:hypothetical protein